MFNRLQWLLDMHPRDAHDFPVHGVWWGVLCTWRLSPPLPLNALHPAGVIAGGGLSFSGQFMWNWGREECPTAILLSSVWPVSNRGKTAGCRRPGWASCASAQGIEMVKEAEKGLWQCSREEDRRQKPHRTEWQHGWGLRGWETRWCKGRTMADI